MLRLVHVACLCVLVVPTMAHGQANAAPRLHWQAPAGCPSSAELKLAVERWLNKTSEPIDPRGLLVDARVEQDRGQWRLTLVIESASGRSREQLRARDCSTLLDAVGLKVMLAASTFRAKPPPKAGTPEGLHEPATPRRSELHASARVTGGLAFGVLPEFGPLLALAGVVRWTRLRLELAVWYAPPQAAWYAAPSTVGANFQLLSAQLRACVSALTGRLEVPSCLGAGIRQQHSFPSVCGTRSLQE